VLLEITLSFTSLSLVDFSILKFIIKDWISLIHAIC
jgi:hypothetical protein